ncbi:FecR domain-containing protein [uncultured Bacteroides sp.]|uniref:FecR family protein n=1 Tax=uncultured Bacteroides sp. TaxID=162156 RepID=UPI002AABFDA8|nr:FecR domain-containing protein [uncultured Bacteroides sp.]
MIKNKIEKEILRGNTSEDKVRRFLFVHELLRRYARGETTELERRVVDAWQIDENEFSSQDRKNKKTLLSLTELDYMDECIYHKVAINQLFPEAEWGVASKGAEIMLAMDGLEGTPKLKKEDTLVNKKKKQGLGMRTIHLYVGIAAMIAIIALTAVFKHSYQDTVFESHNSLLSRQLPDDTRVQMNRDSRLVLENAFNNQNRSVEMSGEIFFDVAKNPRKPFIIAHSALQTEVKGTSFTVKDYPELDVSTVTVRTGLVTVSRGGKQLATLLPNKQLVYHKNTGEYTIRDMNWKVSAGWIQGDIVLIDANEKELALRIKQYFGKELVIEDEALGGDICFNSEFAPKVTLAEVMDRLMLVYGAQYKIDGSRIIVYR